MAVPGQRPGLGPGTQAIARFRWSFLLAQVMARSTAIEPLERGRCCGKRVHGRLHRRQLNQSYVCILIGTGLKSLKGTPLQTGGLHFAN